MENTLESFDEKLSLPETPRIPSQKIFNFITELSQQNDLSQFLVKYSQKSSSNFSSSTSNTMISSSSSTSSPLDFSNSIHENILQFITQQLTMINLIYEKSYQHNSNEGNQANLLSITHLRGIYTSLEIIWCWGILPYLQLNLPSSKEPLPKSIIIQSSLIYEVTERLKTSKENFLPDVFLLDTLFRTCSSYMFRGMMIERNFKRVLCTCISILCHWTPQSHPLIDIDKLQAARKYCQNLLNRVIIDPIVSPDTFSNTNISEQSVDIDRDTTIEALRYVSMVGSSSMQSIVASLLAMILIQPDGLRSTLSVYLSGESEDRLLSTRLTNIAKLITSIPTNLPLSFLNSCYNYFLSSFQKNYYLLPQVEAISDKLYYLCLTYQLTKLFPALQKSKNSNVMLTACVLILGRLSLASPDLVSYMTLQIWSQPILRIGSYSKPKYFIAEDEFLHKPATESEILDCVELYHIICTCVPLNSNLVDLIIHNGIADALFALSIYVLESAPLANIRQYLVGICKEILIYGDNSKIVSIFEQIITFGWRYFYRLTENGGIEVTDEDTHKMETASLPSLLGSIKANSIGETSEESEDYISILREALLQQEASLFNIDSGPNSNYALTEVQKVMDRTRGVCKLILEITPEDSESESIEGESLVLFPSKLFIRMLRGYLDISTHELEDTYVTSIPSHICGIVVLVMKSHLSINQLLRDGYQILLLLGTFLEARGKSMSSSMLMETYERNPSNSSKASTGLIEEIVNLHPNSSLPSNDEEGSPDEMITTVLALLGSIMELGSFRRSDNEEKILRSVILPALQTIAGHDSDTSIREMASDVALMIMVRGHSSKKKERSESLPPDESKVCELEDIEKDLLDVEPPIRAYGIKRLASYIRQNSQKLTTSEQLVLKDILIRMLGDDESFVYLAAVHALSRVVDMNRKLFIPALLEVFCGKSAIPVSLKIRAALGEVLSISLRRASDLAPLFVPSVVFGCIQICRNRVYLPQTDGIHANLSKMRLNIPSEQDLSEKTNSVIMELNQNIELYSNSADSIYFRQSAYSLLSEAIACGGWTAIKYLPDTLDIAIGTLLMEYDHQIQENQIIRRCSVFLLQYILKSLSQKLFQISNGGNYLKDIKRMLTVCSRDKDPVVAYHSQRGLYILDELVKEQFKPNEDDEIPKIRILN